MSSKRKCTRSCFEIARANRSEIAIRVFSRGHRTGACAPSPSTRRRTAWPSTASRRTRPTSSARAKARSGAYSTSRASSRWPRKRAWIHPSRLRFPCRRTRSLPAPARGGHHLSSGRARESLLELMGDKTAARALAQKVNVPVLPGNEEPVTTAPRRLKAAKEIGFPLIIKAAFGGGGRGMRVVHKPGDLAGLLDEAQGEAGRAFGNPAVFLEKYIPRAKHIEVQILGDSTATCGSSARARLLGAAPPPEGHRNRAQRRPAESVVRGIVRGGGARMATRSNTTTPARWNSSTTSTSTSGSSSR
jgi:hypothetical protein